jgi:hypothetical protein
MPHSTPCTMKKNVQCIRFCLNKVHPGHILPFLLKKWPRSFTKR